MSIKTNISIEIITSLTKRHLPKTINCNVFASSYVLDFGQKGKKHYKTKGIFTQKGLFASETPKYSK